MPDMTAEILITRPEHDEPTSYLASWCNPVIRFAEERGIKVMKQLQFKFREI